MVNRRNRRPNRGTASITKVVSKLEKGSIVRPPSDPPSYNPAPWWPLTIVATFEAAEVITPVTIHKAILTSLDQKEEKYVFKLMMVRVWGLNRQPIKLTPYEQMGGSEQLTSITDYGDPMHFSKAGYRFGLTSKLDVHNSTDTKSLFGVAGKLDASNKALCYVSLLIRVAAPTAPTTALEAIVDNMSSQIKDIQIA